MQLPKAALLFGLALVAFVVAFTKPLIPMWAPLTLVSRAGRVWRLRRRRAASDQRLGMVYAYGCAFGEAKTHGAAVAIYVATALGVGISTTHTITGAIVGAGATRRLSAVRWGVAGRVVWAWVLTIPASGILAALTYWLTTLPNRALTVTVITLFVAGAGVAARRTMRADQHGEDAVRAAHEAAERAAGERAGATPRP